MAADARVEARQHVPLRLMISLISNERNEKQEEKNKGCAILQYSS